ncbi:MAG TPA: cysteine desulfurase [Steroidobacteraceae bacterium]|nr:cysteine desulfurase [Steroidobacteraceae bacterium]
MSARDDFPVLARVIHGKPLAYLDNGASAQRPRAVIDAVNDYERHHHANIHRGVHTLSQEATGLYESARDRLVRFIGARSRHEIIFVRGATEAINLVAQSYARPLLQSGDEILITYLEHHANIVPWQLVCEQTGAKLVVAPMDQRGEIHMAAVESLMSDRTRLFACAHVSNALGTVLPVKRLIAAAKARGIATLVDGAQAVPHMPIDVQDLGCDFYTFSGHKLFGPTGIGVLYGREALLERMPPWQGGGDMILAVTFGKTTYNSLPYKFEAGTPNISGAIGLGAAIEFLGRMDLEGAHAHEHALLAYATDVLSEIESLRIIGTAPDKASLVSFVVDGVHPHDLGTILDEDGIAVRTGHHCAMPVMDYFKLAATARASFAFYNTFEEIDRLGAGILRARSIFA